MYTCNAPTHQASEANLKLGGIICVCLTQCYAEHTGGNGLVLVTVPVANDTFLLYLLTF